MMIALLIVLVLIVLAAISSLHLGPHVLFSSGVAGVGAALVFVIDIVFVSQVAPTLFSLALLLLIAALSTVFVTSGLKSVKQVRTIVSGRATSSGLLTAVGISLTDLNPVGTVRILGETWTAESLSGSIKAGVEVYVSHVEGLRLKVWANPEHSQNVEQEDRA